MNYPDDYRAANNPFEQPGPEDICPDALEALERVHNVYRGVLDALVDLSVKNRQSLTIEQIECIMESVGEELAHNSDDALSELKSHGFTGYSYTPEDSEGLIAKAHEEIIDHLRIKPLDVNDLIASMHDHMVCAAKNERRLTRPEGVGVL